MLDDRTTSRNVTFKLAPRPMSVRTARHRVERLTAGLPTDVREIASILTSEVATNAVVHGRTPFSVVARVDDQVVRISVTDQGGGCPKVQPSDPLRGSGWGLSMVQTGAACWGVDHDGDLTTVWFELDVR